MPTPDEFAAYQKAKAEGKPYMFKGEVKDYPQNFKNWVAENAERMEGAKSLPYFVKDNVQAFRSILGKDAAKIFGDEQGDTNVEALPNTPGSIAEQLSMGMKAWDKWKDNSYSSLLGWINKKGYKGMSKLRYEEFYDEMCKDVGIYEIIVGWKKGGIVHCWNVVLMAN